MPPFIVHSSILFVLSSFFDIIYSGTEAQANATVAGHRMNRVLGGANGYIQLDYQWSAYYSRCNEIVLIATYPSHQDSMEATRATELARNAVLQSCGGKLQDVTLNNLNKIGSEIQLSVRKAILGYGQLTTGALGSMNSTTGNNSNDNSNTTTTTATTNGKGLDLASVIISPEPLNDDSHHVALRTANDVTNPTTLTVLIDSFTNISSRADLIGEGFRNMKPNKNTFYGSIADALYVNNKILKDHAKLTTTVTKNNTASDNKEEDNENTTVPILPVRDSFVAHTLATIVDHIEEASTANVRCSRRSRALLGLIPANILDQASPPPSPPLTPRSVTPPPLTDFDLGNTSSHFDDDDDWGDSTTFGKKSNNKPNNHDDLHLWEPSAEAVTAEEDWGPPPEPPMPDAVVTIRIGAQLNEVVTITSRNNGTTETASTEGTLVLKYMYGGVLSEAVQATGHGPLHLYIALRSPAPLASITVLAPPLPSSDPSQPLNPPVPQHIEVPQQPPGTVGPVLTLVPLQLPPRLPNLPGNAAQDLATITYKYPNYYVPPVLKAQCMCRLTFQPQPDDGSKQVHKFTDALLKFMVASTVTAAPSQVSFLVQLPTLPKDTAGNNSSNTIAAVYSDPVGKPYVQYLPNKSQLLWSIVETDAIQPPNGINENDFARTRTHFIPGKSYEFKARIPVTNGLSTKEDLSTIVNESNGGGIVQAVPLQVRFVLADGAIAAAKPEASTPEQQTETIDETSGHKLKVNVASVVLKTSSQVRGMFK